MYLGEDTTITDEQGKEKGMKQKKLKRSLISRREKGGGGIKTGISAWQASLTSPTDKFLTSIFCTVSEM